MATKHENGLAGAYVARMETEHFSFCALGGTATKARKVIARKFNELALEPMTTQRLNDWYGINVDYIAFGEAVRI